MCCVDFLVYQSDLLKLLQLIRINYNFMGVFFGAEVVLVAM